MIRKLKFGLLIFFIVVFFPTLILSQTDDQKNRMLESLIQIALKNNPKLEAAVFHSLSQEKTIPQAGALPDPQLTFGLMNLPINSFSFSQEPMTGKVVGLMQMFPFPGKLSLATDMAEYEAASVKYQQEEIRNQIIQMVKNLYYDLYAVDRALEIIEKNKELLKHLIQVTETKYATGSGLQQDVLRAQVEMTKLEDDRIMWTQKRSAVTAQINSYLNRPIKTPVEKTPVEMYLTQFSNEDFDTANIEAERPLLKAWREKIQKAEAASKLAHRELWPNFTLGATYSHRNDLSDGRNMPDFFSATVSINIPIFVNRKQNARIAEKQLALSAIKSEFKDINIKVLAEAEKIFAELEWNRKRFELYKGCILLQAQQSLESAQAGYRVGKVDFLTLINNWMMLQNYELQLHFAAAGFYKKLADLEFALGGELKNIEE